MATNLARIFGTEEDRVNCSFYLKIGTCRHGERCSRQHMRPTFSQTLLLPHFYLPPSGRSVEEVRDHYEDFYEEVLRECLKFGDVEAVMVCDNLGDHMLGNVYVKYCDEEDTEKAVVGLSGRFYAGRLVTAELSPVTDFREGRCRKYDEHYCMRGGYCNFLHLKAVPRFARKYLRRERVDRRRRRSRSRGRGRRGYRKFPIRGTSEERRACISQWNQERERRLGEMDRIQGREPKTKDDNKAGELQKQERDPKAEESNTRDYNDRDRDSRPRDSGNRDYRDRDYRDRDYRDRGDYRDRSDYRDRGDYRDRRDSRSRDYNSRDYRDRERDSRPRDYNNRDYRDRERDPPRNNDTRYYSDRRNDNSTR